MASLSLFKKYLEVEAELVNAASKEELAQCARYLAINLAHYEITFGELPLDNTLLVLDEAKPNESQVEMLNRGMENMVGLLGSLVSNFNHEKLN